jgi:hypothetical protein
MCRQPIISESKMSSNCSMRTSWPNQYFVIVSVVAVAIASSFGDSAEGQDDRVRRLMDGFDDYMAKILKDWNAPGIGVAVVSEDRLVFAYVYGLRDF